MRDLHITARKRTVLSPWVTLVERHVARHDGRALGAFHSLEQADYVNILAVTRGGDFLLVEQFRPAREGLTLELPGGLVDPGEMPAACAARELAEETGYRITAEPTLLGRVSPDPGRLDNYAWCYFADKIEPIAGWEAEEGVVPHLLSRPELDAAIRSGAFDHGVHLGILGLALLRGKL
jgi:ADP-ribose pyrophosphatase